MKHAVSVLLFIVLALDIGRMVHAAPPAGYYLVWSDEFNGSSLDTTKWAYRLPGAYRDAYNTPNAVSFNGSNLVITTYTSGGTNFSSMLYSKGKFESKFGYWESNVKWGDSNGVWSSFWMLSPSYSHSASSLVDLSEPQVAGSELDTCEHRYVDSSNTNVIANQIGVNLHWYDGSTTEINSPGSGLVGSSLATGFHTYGFLWTSNAYSFLVDGAQVYNGGAAPVSQCTEYALLSSAVDDTSTTWAGFIPANGYGSQSTSLTKFKVDYVRYYAPTNVLFWTGASSAYWTNSANWLSNMPPLSNSDLTFSYLSGSALTTTPGQNYSLDGLVILTTSGSVSIGGANTLTLGPGGIDMVAANNTATISAPVNVGAAQTWGVGVNSTSSGPNTLTVSGNISGTNTVTKSCYGTLILSGANAFSGLLNVDTASTNNNDGIVRITSSAAIASTASPISIRNTGAGVSTFQLDPPSGGIVVPQTISMAGRGTNIAAIESVTGSNTLSGGLVVNSGGSQYLVQADAGTLNLGGTISAGGTVSNACTLTLLGNGNFYISGSIQNGNAPAIGVVKTNSGSLTFAGQNTYTGATTVAEGSVVFANGSLAGGLTINAGCALSGQGTIGGTATIQSGGALAPGSFVGALNFGNLVLGTGSVTSMEINAALSTNFQLTVAGTMTFGGTLIVTNLAGNVAPGQNFRLFAVGGHGGNFTALSLPPLNTGLAWNINGLTNGALSVVATVAPQFTSIKAQAGVVTLAGTCAASQGCELEAATNLTLPAAWSVVTNTTAGINGVFQFTDSPGTIVGARFYRIVTVP